MDKKVLKKLEEKSFVEKIISVENEKEIVNVFKDAGVKISADDAKDIIRGKEDLLFAIENMTEEDIKCAGGREEDKLKDSSNHDANSIDSLLNGFNIEIKKSSGFSNAPNTLNHVTNYSLNGSTDVNSAKRR